MDDHLRRLIANWVRAEWEYRLGSRAYMRVTQEWLETCERRMRRALTGEKALDLAYEKLKEEGQNDRPDRE